MPFEHSQISAAAISGIRFVSLIFLQEFSFQFKVRGSSRLNAISAWNRLPRGRNLIAASKTGGNQWSSDSEAATLRRISPAQNGHNST
jgi:hypothetical protein